jgi:hypothetical protein
MVALENTAESFGSSCGQKSQGRIGGDDGKREWAGAGTTERPIVPPLFRRDALLAQRISLLERLAECANEIKRIDEQLNSDLKADKMQ